MPVADRTSRWLAHEILPHEGDVRRWVRRLRSPAIDEDDIVQEAYCRLARVADPDAIVSARAYFFTVVRNLAMMRLREAQLVSFTDINELGTLHLPDPAPSPEDVVGERQRLRWVAAAIDRLPEKCRRVFVMRRLHGWSQKEIAARLGIAESTVEKLAAKGLRTLLLTLAEQNALPVHHADPETSDGKARVAH